MKHVNTGRVIILYVPDIMRHFVWVFTVCKSTSPVENQKDLELDFKVFFFADSFCLGIVLDESN